MICQPCQEQRHEDCIAKTVPIKVPEQDKPVSYRSTSPSWCDCQHHDTTAKEGDSVFKSEWLSTVDAARMREAGWKPIGDGFWVAPVGTPPPTLT